MSPARASHPSVVGGCAQGAAPQRQSLKILKAHLCRFWNVWPTWTKPSLGSWAAHPTTTALRDEVPEVGSSSLRVYVGDLMRLKACPLRRRLQSHVATYLRPCQAVLTRLIVVVLCQTRAQAAVLEKWLHLCLHACHPDMRIPQEDGQAKAVELYKTSTLEKVLRQLEDSARKSCSQQACPTTSKFS